ncbi:hypothetical protein ACVPOS_03335 [Staphylococcus aureus]
MTKLKNQEFPEISEGSILSSFNAFKQKGYVDTTIKKSSNGRPRRNTIRLPIQV